jgi:cellulose synthase/poly-beta-1,6-N-acetylglucosamine synthase-like glycosyltransferase
VIRRIAVIIPAADEGAHIADCLMAVRTARLHLQQHAGMDVAVRVIVVLDRCRDNTARAVRAFPEAQPLEINRQCVGAAREAGARVALVAVRADELWLANTDADSRVPPTWLTHLLAEARAGAEITLGTVQPAVGVPPSIEARWLARHHLRDGHPHVHGANLAVRGDVHAALGGWRALRSGEDVDLARRVAHRRVSRTGAVPVITSVRAHGRAPRGFSSYLRSLDESSPPDKPGGPPCGS